MDKINYLKNPQNELKYVTKLLSRTTLSFLKINLIGQLTLAVLCIITIGIIVYQCFGNGGGPVHTNGQATIVTLLLLRPFSFGLTLLTMIVAPFLIFTLGNKYIMLRVINRLISEKGEDILFPILDNIFSKIKLSQPKLIENGIEESKLQLKFLQEIKNSKENKWLKKIVIYGLKKVDLNEIDFNDESISYSEIIKSKIIEKLKDISKPSRLFFYSILGWQILILLLTIIKII